LSVKIRAFSQKVPDQWQPARIRSIAPVLARCIGRRFHPSNRRNPLISERVGKDVRRGWGMGNSVDMDGASGQSLGSNFWRLWKIKMIVMLWNTLVLIRNIL
jgi:hypothetical protein